MAEQYRLDFLQERAENRRLIFSQAELTTLAMIQQSFREAEEIVVRLGGKAGRLGECVVGSGLLEATLQALRVTHKTGLPVRIIVDDGAAELFEERMYQQRYWPQISIASTTFDDNALPRDLTEDIRKARVLALDFHGGHDDMPYVERLGGEQSHITQLSHLFRVGVRSYAQRGPERRYADFIEDLLSLPNGSIKGELAQPRLYLAPEDKERYSQLAEAFGLDEHATQVVCFFQSVVLAKCYELWDEVMQLFCEELAREQPGRRIDFLVACGPDSDMPTGFKRADMEDWFRDFTGADGNARVLIGTTPSLHDLAILLSRANLTLSNDTGPGHIAGALAVPTVTVFLPGNLYSRRVWASSLWHRGVTLDPHPYSFRQLEAAVLWGKTDIIDSIPPEQVFEATREFIK